MTIKIIQITDLHLNKDKEFMSHGINTFRSAKKIINEILVKERNVNCKLRDVNIESFKSLRSNH